MSWRKGKGHRRHIVGVLKRNSTKGVRFEYLINNLAAAFKDGFAPYVDFPDTTKTYSENVLDIFGQRLMQSERSDLKKYIDFWELDTKFIEDKYYLLAYTQGLLSTDNFEFLADFYPISGLSFVSEICGLTDRKHDKGFVEAGEVLSWVREPKNPFDEEAVAIKKNETTIGYMKRIHNRLFYKNPKGDISIKVKGVDSNGIINRIFIKVFID